MTGTLNLHSPQDFERAYAGRSADFYAGLLSAVIQYGKPGLILDLGAGLGLFTELAFRWGLRVLGIEGSDYAVRQARQRLSDLPIVQCDLRSPLPMEDRSASNVVLNQVIEHLDPHIAREVLVECHRVLEADGRLFVYSPSQRNRKEHLEPTHINLMLPSELARGLESAGFRVMLQPDQGLWFYPHANRVANLVARFLFRILPRDWVSASANAIAKKMDSRSNG